MKLLTILLIELEFTSTQKLLWLLATISVAEAKYANINIRKYNS